MGITFQNGFRVISNNNQPTPTPSNTPSNTPNSSPTPTPTPTPTPSVVVTNNMLMEDGFNLLQENNNKIIL